MTTYPLLIEVGLVELVAIERIRQLHPELASVGDVIRWALRQVLNEQQKSSEDPFLLLQDENVAPHTPETSWLSPGGASLAPVPEIPWLPPGNASLGHVHPLGQSVLVSLVDLAQGSTPRNLVADLSVLGTFGVTK
jgi:hypothetical protein